MYNFRLLLQNCEKNKKPQFSISLNVQQQKNRDEHQTKVN